MIASQNATIAALEASILQAEKEATALEKELEESGLSDNDIDSTPSSKPVTTQQVFSGPFCMPAYPIPECQMIMEIVSIRFWVCNSSTMALILPHPEVVRF